VPAPGTTIIGIDSNAPILATFHQVPLSNTNRQGINQNQMVQVRYESTL
jgi:hypothetical protein